MPINPLHSRQTEREKTCARTDLDSMNLDHQTRRYTPGSGRNSRTGSERNLVVDEMSSPAGRCAHWWTEQYTSPPSLAGSEFIPSSWRLSRRLGGWCWLWRSIGRWMDVTGPPPVQASVFLARAEGEGSTWGALRDPAARCSRPSPRSPPPAPPTIPVPPGTAHQRLTRTPALAPKTLSRSGAASPWLVVCTHAHAGVRGPFGSVARVRPMTRRPPVRFSAACGWLSDATHAVAFRSLDRFGAFACRGYFWVAHRARAAGRAAPLPHHLPVHGSLSALCCVSPARAYVRRRHGSQRWAAQLLLLCSPPHRRDATKACDNPRRCTSQAEKSATCCAGTPRLRANFKPAQTMSAPLHKLPRKHRRRDNR